MFRKLKTVSLTLATALLASIVVASVVQASQFHATSGENISIFGQQAGEQLVLTVDSGQIKCTQALFEGTVQGSGGAQVTTQDVTLTPTITGCSAFGLATTIDTNGCKLTVTGSHSVTGLTTAKTTYTDITGCTAGKKIEATAAAGCVITVPEQHNLSHATGETNAGSPEDLNVTVTLSGVQYESHGLCPNTVATQVTNNGQLTGKNTFQARVDTGSEQATHNGHQYQKLKQTGALVGLSGT